MSVTLRDYSDYSRNVASGSVAGIFELSALQRLGLLSLFKVRRA